MSTIANGGTRIAPRLVKEIHETSPSGGIGNLEDVVPTKIMNSIQVSKEILDHIKEGLYRVTHVKTERLLRHSERILHKSLVKQGLPKRSIRDQIQHILMKPLKIQPSSRMHHTIIQKS